MSASVSKSFHLLSSSLKIDEDNSIEKKGIITILGSDFQSSKAAATSIRRTLSADMSSNNWLSQNGFNKTMKKIPSFAQLCSNNNNNNNNASSLGDDDHQESKGKGKDKGKGQDEIWASIQSEKNELKSRSWGSLMVEDNKETDLPPPYIHPLVKRTTSSLSEKSLQICTESLGTETGTDDVNEDQEDEKVKININVQEVTQVTPPQQQHKDSFEEVHVVKYSYSYAKKLGPKSFPPPLPSLAEQDGASLQMQSHRQNGRLVLEAVSVPTKNRFHAQRQHGRLLLTLVDDHVRVEETKDEEDQEVVQEFDQVFDGINDEVEIMKVESESETETETESDDEGEEGHEGFVINQTTKLPSGIITMPKGAFMMNKLMGLDNKNLAWSPKLINNAHVKLIEVEDEEEMAVMKNEMTPLPQSLPPPPRVARLISSRSCVPPTANSFDAYEYFWKEKPTMTNMLVRPVRNDFIPNDINNNNKVIMKSNLMGYEQQKLVLMKGDKGDYLVPFLSRCTEPKRSLLFWDSYCIATS